jgi:hypothetical protein
MPQMVPTKTNRFHNEKLHAGNSIGSAITKNKMSAPSKIFSDVLIFVKESGVHNDISLSLL